MLGFRASGFRVSGSRGLGVKGFGVWGIKGLLKSALSLKVSVRIRFRAWGQCLGLFRVSD